MKRILFTAAVAVLALSSCYVGVEGGHHRRHAAAVIQIRADNAAPKDSLHTSAAVEVTKKDSTLMPANTGK